ncbi:hypothetical protein TD95_003773 [Thielaviopsis punctulata]|uniref:GrpB domain protein n=1 Tax=Thielaviopsis punctulata TaxID=72032 RepID=A0A0F4ZHF5_9PEZI|nr:hypothetical protein TD95_003773 [Thielaviopsis punctulata]
MAIAKPTDDFISTATGSYPGVLVARSDVLQHYSFNPAGIERISHRTVPTPMQIEPYSSAWPTSYAVLAARIHAHLPATELLYMQHVGSTSIPNMPAKPVIDIDIVVRDVTDEAAYRPGLEAAGLQFLCREPEWWGHRMTYAAEPYANVHIFGPEAPEPLRHRLFRDYLLSEAGGRDREMYADKKRKVMQEWKESGDAKFMYNDRKEETVRDILGRAFVHAGIVGSEEEYIKMSKD